jgi:hypothetical protein
MLSLDPEKRLGIDDLLASPLLGHDRRYELPPTPEPEMKDGPVVVCRAQVCGEGFGFASLSVATKRRFSQNRFAAIPRMKSVRAKTICPAARTPIIEDDRDEVKK